MADLYATSRPHAEIRTRVVSHDGRVLEFAADDSFRSWWAIVRWNAHYGYWRLVLTGNVPDLFRKVLRRKLWPRSA